MNDLISHRTYVFPLTAVLRNFCMNFHGNLGTHANLVTRKIDRYCGDLDTDLDTDLVFKNNNNMIKLRCPTHDHVIR